MPPRPWTTATFRRLAARSALRSSSSSSYISTFRTRLTLGHASKAEVDLVLVVVCLLCVDLFLNLVVIAVCGYIESELASAQAILEPSPSPHRLLSQSLPPSASQTCSCRSACATAKTCAFHQIDRGSLSFGSPRNAARTISASKLVGGVVRTIRSVFPTICPTLLDLSS
jgi:hypothetical protein